MMHKFFRLLPSSETIHRSRWLRWIGPALHQPRLWHVSRRGVALGMALGIFFGLLVPIAQIPLSVGLAVVVRANVPAAVASTLVTNPLTFGPLYYAAWRLGSAILGQPVREGEQPVLPEAAASVAGQSWFATVTERILGVGKPLLLGLSILASALGLATYFMVSWLWALNVLWQRHRRKARKASQAEPP